MARRAADESLDAGRGLIELVEEALDELLRDAVGIELGRDERRIGVVEQIGRREDPWHRPDRRR